jgi:hypothetical protein
VSQAERAQWQQEASAELAAILAAHPDLPAIPWTITPGGRITGQALMPGNPGSSRELFTAWRQALELEDVQETTMREGASHVRACGSSGTVRLTLTAVVASLDVTDNQHPSSPGPAQAAIVNRPVADVTPVSTWARPALPPGPPGPSPA